MQARMEKTRCMGNLRNLVLGANLYVQDHGHWPQISTGTMRANYPGYSDAWINALKPYGLSQKNWICPTTQKMLGNPDLTKRENIRIDYTPMPFDEKAMTPFRWPEHPWFVERSSVHGNGNLIIFTNGTIHEAIDLMGKPR